MIRPISLSALFIFLGVAACKKSTDDNNVYNPIRFSHDTVCIRMPTAFSPNGDGRNDRARVITANNGITNFRLTITKTNGTTVYQSMNVQDAWDGTDGNGYHYTDYKYVVHLQLTVAGQNLDEFSNLYLIPSQQGCVNGVTGDIDKYIFEDQLDIAACDVTYHTGEIFCN